MDTTNTDTTSPVMMNKAASSFAGVEEFQVMGLRPMEFRPVVIRRAMKQAALPLATLHLQHPSGAVERRLAHLVTTGYRLLDPRRREDSIQRMMLGRIHPQLADEVVRVAQSKGQALMTIDSVDDASGGCDDVAGFITGQQLTAGLFAKGFLSSTFSFDDGSSPWSLSLQSQDLRMNRPIRRALRTTRHWAMKRYLSVGTGAALLFVSSLGTWTMLRDPAGDANAMIQTTSSQAGLAALPLQKTVGVVGDSGNENGPLPEATSEDLNPVLAENHLPAMEEASLAIEGEVSSTEGIALDRPLGGVEPELEREPAVAAPVESTAGGGPVVSPSIIEGSPSFIIERRLSSKKGDPQVRFEAVPAARNKLPMPIGLELGEAASAWEQALVAIGAKDHSVRFSASMAFADEAEANKQPLKMLVALQGAASEAILSGDLLAADAALLRIVETFEADLISIAGTLSIRLVESNFGDREVSRVIEWLGGFVGRSLIAGRLDAAERFASSLAKIAANFQDKAAIERSKEFSKTMQTFRRFEATAVAISSGAVEKVSPSEHFSAGRYWGLVRRDWVKALPHLSVSSDARLAALASNEMLMGGKPDLEELVELAKGYLQAATKSKGWVAESYILHADEILSREASVRTIARELELTRLRSQLKEDFAPVFASAKRMEFQPPAADGSWRGEAVAKPSSVVAGASGSELPDSGAMTGRMQRNGQDLGVELSYEPGVAWTRDVLSQLESRLNLPGLKASIELTGMIQIERPTAVAIVVSGSSVPESQSVTIDGYSLAPVESLPFDAGTSIYRADLAPGMWTLRWSVSRLADGLSFEVFDGMSGSWIFVNKTSLAGKNDLDPLPTHTRVIIAEGP